MRELLSVLGDVKCFREGFKRVESSTGEMGWECYIQADFRKSKMQRKGTRSDTVSAVVLM